MPPEASVCRGPRPRERHRLPELFGFLADLKTNKAATVLSGEPPQHRGATRLAEVVASAESFERERGTLDRRVDRILPANLMYRVETPHGAVGFRKPANAPVGRASVTTVNGEVTIWVWYA
ncbi:DUF7262 family protein [Halorientalis marina]|uniref:DUF7262 family protein n=1 Tax=Halorientalis marina TaxID=2931976 RepID=UPI003FEE71FF